MAFFSSKNSDANTKNYIQSRVVQTENVMQELSNLASSQGVSIHTLDFNLLNVKTFTRIKSDKESVIWQEIEEGESIISNADLLLNSNFEIKQSYEIEIIEAQKNKVFHNFICSIGANSNLCKIYLSVKKDSYLEYCDGFDELFRNFINKKKIRANIIIGLFDKIKNDALSKISANLRIHQKVIFEKNEMLLIAQGVEPVPTVDDKLILHFKIKQQKKDSSNNTDSSKRDFIIGVQKDELLMEYIKPKKGTSGRDCRGIFLIVKEPKIEHEPTFKVNENIRTVDSEINIAYIATKSGYIVYEDDTYKIKEELDINELSFKTTGSIVTELGSDISLNVKEKDIFKDAIGSNVDVEVYELEVEGNVGPKATILAKKAKIDGQTHGSSFVKADELKINVHRGVAEGVNVSITRLERGKISGKNITITQAVSGEINAEHVVIDLLGSHVIVRASKSIEIKKIQGSENRLIIDPLAIENVSKEVEKDEDALQKLEKEIKDLEYDVKTYKELVQNDKTAYLDIAKRLMHYQKNNIKIPQSFIRQFKQFKNTILHLEKLQSLLNDLIEKKDHLTLSINAFQEHILKARIINRDKWIGYNEIRFKLIDPPTELSYSPPEGSLNMIFGLDKDEEGMYKIKGMKQ